MEVVGAVGTIEVEEKGRIEQRPAETVNGRIGRALWWAHDRGSYMVHFFDGGYATVPEDNLREFTPSPPEHGGFDLAWPSEHEGFADFAISLAEVLREKDYCCLQLITEESVREAAREQAARHIKHTVLNEELVTDYLGHHGQGKTAFLEIEVPDPRRPEKVRQDALSQFDRNLSDLAAVVSSISWEMLGFVTGERTQGMLCQPYANTTEADSLCPRPLDDQDIQDGVVGDHIDFLQRRKLCCMFWLDTDGGEVTLKPLPRLNRHAVTLPVSSGKMLIFRCDRMAFEHRPRRRSVVLQTWLLSEKQRTELNLDSLVGDAAAKAEMLGITDGRPHPQGDRTHIMAIHTRLPGGGYGSDGYWAVLLEGTDGMTCIPFLRWDTDIHCTKDDEPHQTPGKCYARHGGFCSHEEIYSFDNKFFGIPDKEAQQMSPSQRITLEDGYTVLHKGGHTRESLSDAKIGVFLGDTGSDWTPYNIVEHEVTKPDGTTSITHSIASTAILGANQSVTCSRLSHCMNMKGPVATADTACSSSLVATSAAMSWMRPREFDPKMKHIESRIKETVVCGVCVQIGVASYIGMCALSMISFMGRCFTFDGNGDGYARGEGTGLMFLKNSEDEIDRINQAACLLSAQINQDGRSASMTAPNGPSQQACIRASMLEAGNQARDINLAECHGTGTALGDPIEVGALRHAMEPRDTTLAMTSSKSNIGHLEGGAGIAGLLKCVVMLNAGTCPPNCHLYELNAHLDVAGFPCIFDTEAIDTHLNSALTGVSSFGFGGTNGRCDIWGQAKFGPRGDTKMHLADLDQITVTCPITLAQIDHVSGEPVMQVPREGLDQKYRPDVLRDEFAPYDVSRFAYDGGFRYRRHEVEDAVDVDLADGEGIYVCGSWSSWKQAEEMQREESGWYISTMVLGEGRYELFDMALGKKSDGLSSSLKIYPVVHRAGEKIWVQGPDNNSTGQKWLIDGRTSEMRSGTVLQIRFKWTTERMQVQWEPVGQVEGGIAVKYDHSYDIVGDFSKWKPVRMSGSQESWQGVFRIPASGKAEFQLVRDGDRQQAIYPSQHGSSRPSTPIRGPDDLGHGRHFSVRGQAGDDVNVRLTIVDGKATVGVTTPYSDVEFRNQKGWASRDYYVLGTFNGAKPLKMTMNSRRPGVFSCEVAACRSPVGDAFGGWGDYFQVTVDGDPVQAFAPVASPAEVPGQVIVAQPDGKAQSNRFLIRSSEPELSYKIILDLGTDDRRRTVMWYPVGAQRIDVA